MSAIEKLVEEAQSAGITFFTDETGKPRMEATTKPDDGLLERLKTNRNDVIQYLQLGDNVTNLHSDNQAIETNSIEFEERAGIIADNPDIPEEWIEGMAVLVSMPLPAMWTQQHWNQVLINTESFMAKWGAQAHRLGWGDNDLFGISQSDSVARVDRLGLVLLLDDKRVTHMTNETAALQCVNIHTGEPNGSTLTFYCKPDMSGSIPVWELISTS